MIFDRLQEEMVEWQRHNFPTRPEWLPLMGAVEELGELVEARDISAILDAVGDITIYLSDYSNAMGYNLTDIWREEINQKTYPITLDHLQAIQIHMGRLAHSHIKQYQHIRMHEDHPTNAKKALGRILMHLDGICTTWLTTLDEVVSSTWSRVKNRDWQKNRNTAHL